MAIAHRGTGTAAFGVNTFTVGIPAAQVTGDMMLILAGGKPFDVGSALALDDGTWTALSSFTDGSTGAGVDTGSMFVKAWYKEATIDTEVDPDIVEGTPNFNIVGGICMVFSKGSTELWDTPVMVGGGDASADTSFSVTAGSDPGVIVNDHCISWAAFRSDAATPCSSHLVATQTGVTFSNTHDPGTDPETTSGGDMGMCVNRASVTAGPGSAAPVIAATLAASHTGSAGFIRLRLKSNPIPNVMMAPYIAR